MKNYGRCGNDNFTNKLITRGASSLDDLILATAESDSPPLDAYCIYMENRHQRRKIHHFLMGLSNWMVVWNMFIHLTFSIY